VTDKTKSVPTEPIEWARKHDTLDEPLNPFQDESIAPVTEQVTHKTVRIKVWADIDEVIAPLVERLNEIPGVTTHASCQGQQAGPHPYGPYVMISWADNVAKERVQREFVLKEEGEGWGYVYGLAAPS
jgi:predicted LPLAT superfamily acyltransferase